MYWLGVFYGWFPVYLLSRAARNAKEAIIKKYILPTVTFESTTFPLQVRCKRIAPWIWVDGKHFKSQLYAYIIMERMSRRGWPSIMYFVAYNTVLMIRNTHLSIGKISWCVEFSSRPNTIPYLATTYSLFEYNYIWPKAQCTRPHYKKRCKKTNLLSYHSDSAILVRFNDRAEWSYVEGWFWYIKLSH